MVTFAVIAVNAYLPIYQYYDINKIYIYFETLHRLLNFTM